MGKSLENFSNCAQSHPYSALAISNKGPVVVLEIPYGEIYTLLVTNREIMAQNIRLDFFKK